MATSNNPTFLTSTNNHPDSELLDIHKDTFRESFNRRPFVFRHHLTTHPLLQLSVIRELARSLETRPGELYADLDVSKIDQRWDISRRPTVPMASLVDNLDRSNAWIIIRHAELDSRYRALLDQAMVELRELNEGRLPTGARKENAIIFATSPHRISTYHIDRECNFLLQIRGEKLLYVFDQNDREILSETELERFWSVDNNAAIYKPAYQERAHVFHLRPGDGVHIPVNAPHWVRNGDELSVSLSFNFQFSDMERANTYRANYVLRRLGFSPSPPGKRPLLDSIKAHAIKGAMISRKPFLPVISRVLRSH